MKILGSILATIYRLWFYTLIAIAILILLPILLVGISREAWYPFFFKMARLWAKIILFGMGFYPIIYREGRYHLGESYMFVSNHSSMVDIMLMLYVCNNPFVFVGKKELEKIPLFGYFYKRCCILVDRDNSKSRYEVFKQAQRKLDLGISICIFPEGGVPDDDNILLDEFKDGAFRLAIEHKIPIAPITFYDNKKRFAYNFGSQSVSPGRMRVKAHKIIDTSVLLMKDRKMLKLKTREIILNELEKAL